MPAGDLVIADYQIELRATLMGPTTAADVLKFSGLGATEPRTLDVVLAHDDGSVAGWEYQSARVITVEMEIYDPGDSSGAWSTYTSLASAWAASISDIPLYFQLPGLGKKYVTGRPRGLTDDGLAGLPHGIIRCQGTFVAHDPTIH